ncbi:MAG: M28 family peptidase [Planctomycetes bacterium]|nr:M28 family peptidase [Planctomycetota bacterium]MCH9727177.1 M28 family peptidase [Planctomycetota bacterium]MCH9778570.1 M28 family peptidase [Planctomycetota bacterium]MCH9792551.1 M28 family peptidase [Planctomycetota bacterium]
MDIDQSRLKQHCEQLCSTIRPAESAELEAARQYVIQELVNSGWEVERHHFQAQDSMLTSLSGQNLIARHPQLNSQNKPRFCVGAHLDTRPESPGADDNTSAVATLLELGRLLPLSQELSNKWALELVAFDLEENGMLGGAEHARLHQQQQTDLRGMVSLEMLGYCDPTPGSQTLPRELIGLYPDTGDFIAIVGNQNSTTLIAAFQQGMEKVNGLPVEILQVPQNGEMLQATRLSDHSPFWDAGYPAVMITDTSFLRNPHYHQPTDTVDTLDFEFLTKVAQGSLEATKLILQGGY